MIQSFFSFRFFSAARLADRWPGSRLVWLMLIVSSILLSSVQGQSYRELVGEPPVPTGLGFKNWLDELVGLRLRSVPLSRPVNYYFASDGDDATGDGSMTRPWKTLNRAQTALNQYAAGASQSGLGLWFRTGDVWRAPAVLQAEVQSIQNNRVVLRPIPAWAPVAKFFYELRGPGGSERVEAKSYNRATGELTLQAAPLASGYTSIYFECALQIAAPNVTVGAYTPSGAAARAKPRFTRFQPANGWRGAAERQDALQNTWSLAALDPVGWISAGENLDRSFRRVSSPEEVNQNAGTWHWDGRVLWARDWLDTAMNSGFNQYETVLENRWDGISVADVDGVRIDSILVDGWGMTAQPALTGTQQQHSGYGFLSTASGTNHVVFSHCESYYNNRHCFGNLTPETGGLLTMAWCSWGYCVEGGGAVSYASGGGNEVIYYGCVNRAGSVLHGAKPYTANSAVSGYSHFCHAGAGKKVALFISYRCQNMVSPVMAGHCGPGDMPSAQNLSDCRSFVVEDVYRVRFPTVFDRTKPAEGGRPGILRPGLANETVYLNCWLEHALLWSGGNFVPIINGNLVNTRLINTVLTYRSLADDYATSLPRVGWEVSGLAAYNSHLDVDFGTGRSVGYVGKLSSAGQNTIKNTILSFSGANYADPLTAVSLRSVNNAAALGNNYYAGFTALTGAEGFDADPWRLVGSPLLPGLEPDADSILVSSHPQLVDGLYPIEFDFDWKVRPAGRSAIGPFEAWSAPGGVSRVRLAIRLQAGQVLLTLAEAVAGSAQLEAADRLISGTVWRRVGPIDERTPVAVTPPPGTKAQFFRVVIP